jgi:hypothetical protein
LEALRFRQTRDLARVPWPRAPLNPTEDAFVLKG